MWGSRVNANQIVTITRDGARLFAALRGAAPVELFAESETTFFARTANAQLVFNVDGGKADRLLLRLNDMESTAYRAE